MKKKLKLKKLKVKPIPDPIEFDFDDLDFDPGDIERKLETHLAEQLKIKCECGSEKCGYNTHSDWCPKHRK